MEYFPGFTTLQLSSLNGLKSRSGTFLFLLQCKIQSRWCFLCLRNVLNSLLNIARSQPAQEQARVQEIPEIQVTERVQDLIIPERIEEVRQKLFVAEETTQSVAEFSDSAPGRVFQHATSTDVIRSVGLVRRSLSRSRCS